MSAHLSVFKSGEKRIDGVMVSVFASSADECVWAKSSPLVRTIVCSG